MQDEPERDPGQRAVQSVEVGGRLLLALAAEHGPMNLKDLAAQAGLTPARAHPYLVSFGKLGLIEQDKSTGRYALGPSALQVGLASLSQLDPVRVAGPVAEELAASTGFAVALALWGNLGPTVIRMIEARQPLLVAMRSGTVMSILGTATGRAFAGALPEDRVARASPVGDEPAHAAAFSAAELKVLRQARQDLRAHGLVRAEGRPIPGVNAFSAPIRNAEGQMIMALSVTSNAERLTSDWDGEVPRGLVLAASEISEQIARAQP